MAGSSTRPPGRAAIHLDSFRRSLQSTSPVSRGGRARRDHPRAAVAAPPSDGPATGRSPGEGSALMAQATRTILCTVGTRPEAIKMAPVIRALRAAPWARCRVLLTAQHRDLVDPMLAFFAIDPDLDLDIM